MFRKVESSVNLVKLEEKILDFWKEKNILLAQLFFSETLGKATPALKVTCFVLTSVMETTAS